MRRKGSRHQVPEKILPFDNAKMAFVEGQYQSTAR